MLMNIIDILPCHKEEIEKIMASQNINPDTAPVFCPECLRPEVLKGWRDLYLGHWRCPICGHLLDPAWLIKKIINEIKILDKVLEN
jgi:Zn ribbon nucleic-acid-binding protein